MLQTADEAIGGGRDLRRAVIDIGSNSVRLVIFEGPPRAPFAIVNEKSLCGLGRDIGPDGRLNPAAVAAALETLRRFRKILSAYGDPPARAVATAALRGAADGADFVARAREVDLEVEIIGGAREAELAALGVVSFEPRAQGVIGDMGGGSLELVAVRDGELGDAASLPIGAFSLIRASGGDMKKARALAREEIAKASFLAAGSDETIYAVGGAWRALARMEMRVRGYPLPILHEYVIPRAKALSICDFVASQSRESLESDRSVPRRRIDAIPYAAIVLGETLQASSATRVIVSAGGLREGLIYDSLTPEARALDPLIVGAEFFARRLSPSPEYGRAAAQTIAPLFEADGPARTRIVAAACALIDAGSYFHPDHRGRQAYDAALRASLYGVTHDERVMLAIAARTRYEGKGAETEPTPVDALLEHEARLFALRLGLAMRFVATFAPKAAPALEACALRRVGDAIVFEAPAQTRDLLHDSARKRLTALADAFDLELRTDFED
ncbi:MAG: Ppx/GppA phosphatase family protein [Pseudomonadota bacterium]